MAILLLKHMKIPRAHTYTHLGQTGLKEFKNHRIPRNLRHSSLRFVHVTVLWFFW